ncbi:MAG: CPBP family intramembrane glutamic endopeptidase, partial [Planctomycetales bacterium]
MADSIDDGLPAPEAQGTARPTDDAAAPGPAEPAGGEVAGEASPGPATVQVALARPPGPGLPEALGWTIGLIPAQFACAAVATLCVIVGVGLGVIGRTEDLQAVAQDPSSTPDLIRQHEGAITAGTLGLFVLLAIAAARLRLGRAMLRKLSLRRVGVPHAALTLCAVLPAALVAGQTNWCAQLAWERLCEWAPGLRWLDPMDVRQAVLTMLDQLPWPVLLLALAAAPAIAEEILFRGVIGRGLVARWGIAAGVAITSLLFCAIHIHPAHAVGVLPLAIVIHLMYLATRSFYVPMAIHFLNNSFALAAARSQAEFELPGMNDAAPVPPLLFAASLACLLAILWTAWKSRVEFRLPNGEAWDPGFPTAEAPPREDARRVRRRAGVVEWVLVAVAIAAFFATMAGYAI